MIEFPMFAATFPNSFAVEKVLPTPTQEMISREPVAFAWCPLDKAMREAGPLTKDVLENMLPSLRHRKKYIFVDSKVQLFAQGDAPIDSLHWHVDGSISVEDENTKKLGYILLHDMYARMKHPEPPTFLAYQSSQHCATQYLADPVTVTIPKCIPSFSVLHEEVERTPLRIVTQQACSIVSFDGWTLHKAVRARESGWRLWVRIKETDHFTEPKRSAAGSQPTAQPSIQQGIMEAGGHLLDVRAHQSTEVYGTTFR